MERFGTLHFVPRSEALDADLRPPAAAAANTSAANEAEHGGETDATAYFRDALAFLEDRHGAANVVAVNVQNDESAPHLVVYVIPLVERPARIVRKSVFSGGRDENVTKNEGRDYHGHVHDDHCEHR